MSSNLIASAKYKETTRLCWNWHTDWSQKPGIVGSSPTKRTNKISVCRKVRLIHFVGNEEIAGSTPAARTRLNVKELASVVKLVDTLG